VARALEEVYASDLEPNLVALGLHYRESETWGKALAYLHRAGEQAAMRSAHQEAINHFQAALAVLDRIPATRETLERRVAILVDLGPSLITEGDWTAVLEMYERARELCARLGETPYLFPVLWGLSRAYDRVRD